MRAAFAHGFRDTVGALLLSSFIAGGVCAMTNPGGTKNEQAISVNRVSKADRMSPAQLRQQFSNESPSIGSARGSAERTPFGCDPAFSPVVEPKLAHIYKRCMV